MSEKLKPCSHCRELVQLQVQRIDFKNPWRDIIKCRGCKSQATRMYWNHRPIENAINDVLMETISVTLV